MCSTLKNKLFHVDNNQKKGRVTILISDIADFKTMKVFRNKGGVIGHKNKGAKFPDKTIVTLHMPRNRSSLCESREPWLYVPALTTHWTEVPFFVRYN